MKKYQWNKQYINEISIENFGISSDLDIKKLWKMIDSYSFSYQPWKELDSKINNKAVYVPYNSQCALILDICNEELKKIYNIKQSDRNNTIYNIKSILKDNLDLRIYRKDIYRFYESIDPHILINKIEHNNNISFIGKRFIVEFLSYCIDTKLGLPRGIALSATLAEILLLDFDYVISNQKEVILYFRYVDDIFIICPKNYEISEQHIEDTLKKTLPSPLKFNTKGTKNQKLELTNDSVSRQIKFSYLGYEFTLQKGANNNVNRVVHLDISPDKIRKFKTKIIKSFLNYDKNKDYNLLERRIVFLTHNHILTKKSKNPIIKSGIYYSYSYANPDGSGSIFILDKFLKRQIWDSTLSRQQKRKLYKRTFTHGFRKKIVLKYSYSEFQEITKVWKNG